MKKLLTDSFSLVCWLLTQTYSVYPSAGIANVWYAYHKWQASDYIRFSIDSCIKLEYREIAQGA